MYIYIIYIKIGIVQSYIESPDSQLHMLIIAETDDDPPCHNCFGEKIQMNTILISGNQTWQWTIHYL